MQLISTLRSDLSTAMKAQDSAKVKLIRSLLHAIDNASAVPVVDTVDAIGIYEGDAPRRTVEWGQVRSILKDEIDERNTAAGLYNDPEAVARMHHEVMMIEGYLALFQG
jgi:uncharacterized protein YqeY